MRKRKRSSAKHEWKGHEKMRIKIRNNIHFTNNHYCSNLLLIERKKNYPRFEIRNTMINKTTLRGAHSGEQIHKNKLEYAHTKPQKKGRKDERKSKKCVRKSNKMRSSFNEKNSKAKNIKLRSPRERRRRRR